ncbi:MAG: hypothetical protein ABI240_13245 [Sphingomonas sp.]
MEEERARYRCFGDDGTCLTVVEYRYVQIARSEGKIRRQLGACRLTLTSGEPARYIDPETFEIIGTGELLRRFSLAEK